MEGELRMKTEIDQAVKRTQQYWYEDGLVELSFGGMCVVLGIYFLVLSRLPEDSTAYQMLNMAFPLIIIGGGALAGRIVKSLKNRVTFPRTGFVAYRRESGRSRMWAIVFSILVGAIVAVMFVTAPVSLAWMPAVSGGLIGLVLFILGTRLGLGRVQALGGGSILLGLGISLAGAGDTLGLGVYYSLFGLLVMVSGWLALRSYLRHTTPADDAGGEAISGQD